ncbi:hypothetical protein Tco_0554216 [Tanacetum coccineum]
MLEKGGYDTWKSRILLYIEGKENGQMLLNYIFKGPYQLNKIDDPGNPKIRREKGKRLYTMVELKYEERKQVKCDIKVANIIQRLPNDIYTFLNHRKTAKSIWNRVKELMDGTKLRQQEKETKLTDEFTRIEESQFKEFKDDRIKVLGNYARNTRNVTVTRNYVGNVGRIAGNVGNTGNRTGKAVNVGVAGTQEIKTVGDYAYANVVKVIKCYNSRKDEARISLDDDEHHFLVDHLDESDSDCEEDLSANAIFMVKLTPAGSLTENDERQHSKRPVCVNDTCVEEMSDIKIISSTPDINTNGDEVAQYGTSLYQENGVIMTLIENRQREVEHCNTVVIPKLNPYHNT